jgi:pimeloyl-ACP methyl ester carboxylesterase
MRATIELSQGTIHYRDDGAGEPIVFVHGLLVDGRLWQHVTPLLSHEHRCITPDLPLGSHSSPLRDGAERSPRGIARLLAELLDALELERVTLVANDTGGAIAQILAAERPERLRALVLTNCDCLENFPPALLRPMRWLTYVPGAYAALARATGSARLRRSPLGFGLLSRRALPDDLTADWLVPLRRRAIRADVIATIRAIHSSDTLEAAERLRERPLPLLLAWAPNDRFFPLRYAQRLAEMVPGSELELMRESRTFVPHDEPERLAQLIDEFVRAQAQSPQQRDLATSA